MFLEFIKSREVHHCRIQVPVFPFQGKKSWHLPTEYILTYTLYYENVVWKYLWTQILVLLFWLRLSDLQYWAMCTKCIWPHCTFELKIHRVEAQERSGKEY